MLKRILLGMLCVGFLLCSTSICGAYEDALSSMSQGLTRDIIKSGKKRVAVVDFTDLKGNITELGRFVSEELSVNLTRNSSRYEMSSKPFLMKKREYSGTRMI